MITYYLYILVLYTNIKSTDAFFIDKEYYIIYEKIVFSVEIYEQ